MMPETLATKLSAFAACFASFEPEAAVMPSLPRRISIVAIVDDLVY
jgi:hypothetical protein